MPHLSRIPGTKLWGALFVRLHRLNPFEGQINYLVTEWFVPKTGLEYYRGSGEHTRCVGRFVRVGPIV